MKRQIYFLLTMFFYTPLMSNEMIKKDRFFNGFTHFLNEIYSYESKQLVGGLSKNKQYLYSVNGNRYVVRVLGEEFSKRRHEITIHSMTADKDIAPKMHYHDDEYSFMIMDFIEGHTLDLEEAKKPEVLDLMVQKVHVIRQLDPEAFMHENGWNLFSQINKDYIKIKNQYPSLGFMIDDVFNEMNSIHESLQKESRSLVACHNDLNYRNIFFTQNDLIFIDWEMAGVNYDFYDLAYYSIFSCLSEVDERYLLKQYLQHIPSRADYDYFNRIKLMIRCCNAFYLLAFIENISDSFQSVSMESVKDFEVYARIFCDDPSAISSEFLYSIAVSQLKRFLEEFKAMENGVKIKMIH